MISSLPDVPPPAVQAEEEYHQSPPMSAEYIVVTPPVEEQAFLAFPAPAPGLAMVAGQDDGVGDGDSGAVIDC